MKVYETGAFPEWKQERKQKNRKAPYLCAILSVIPKEHTIIDLGASTGTYVELLRENGYTVIGIDGTPKIEEITKGLVKHTDLAKNCSHLYDCSDWAIFVEVGEHIPKKYETKLLDNLCKIPKIGLIVIWGPIGCPGFCHVNCREPEYVVEAIEKRGWKLSLRLTRKFRKRTRRKVRRSVLVFLRNKIT